MMCRRIVFAVLAIGLMSVLFNADGRPSATPQATEKGKPKVQIIGLDTVYSTADQKGLQVLRTRLEEPHGKHLDQLHRDSHGMGPSNIFLVRGKDVAQAVACTRLAFLGGRSADVPVIPGPGLNEAPFWVVAYLGPSWSEPPAWVVHSVQVQNTVVRVSVSKPKAKERTTDVHQYFVWAPLGKLDAGAYTLELFDAEEKQLRLLRRVAVTGQ